MLNKLARLPTPIYALKYADDGIFFSNHDVNPLDVLVKQNALASEIRFAAETGCIFSIEKSEWVKRHGV